MTAPVVFFCGEHFERKSGNLFSLTRRYFTYQSRVLTVFLFTLFTLFFFIIISFLVFRNQNTNTRKKKKKKKNVKNDE